MQFCINITFRVHEGEISDVSKTGLNDANNVHFR